MREVFLRIKDACRSFAPNSYLKESHFVISGVFEEQARDIEAYEFHLGEVLVANERRCIRRRCRTIARNHRKTATWKSQATWVLESRALVRYFDSQKDADVENAKAMLKPYDLQFHLARASTSKSTVGVEGHIK